MQFLTSEIEARKVDSQCKNKWKKEWLNEMDSLNRPFGLWYKKADEAGTAWCHLCSKRLVYKSNGKKSLHAHAVDPTHCSRLSAQAHTSTLPTAEPVMAGLSTIDRITDAKICTCAFLAEHGLPFSLAPALIDFAKTMGEDPQALKGLSMNRSTAAYTLTHGVAPAFREELLNKLTLTFLCL